jgi:hypothetical protein
MTDRLSEGHYTILTLEHLILVNQLVNLNTLMESTTTPHLLMISCETNQLLNVEAEQILRSLKYSEAEAVCKNYFDHPVRR